MMNSKHPDFSAEQEDMQFFEVRSEQTRDPFQLELLDAVKRRQKKGTGFVIGQGPEATRHDKALDIRMEKFLANKQSPFRTEARSPSLTEKRFQDSLSPGTSSINKPSNEMQTSKWKPPSIEITTDDDGIDMSSDEDDGVVSGFEEQRKNMKQGTIVKHIA